MNIFFTIMLIVALCSHTRVAFASQEPHSPCFTMGKSSPLSKNHSCFTFSNAHRELYLLSGLHWLITEKKIETRSTYSFRQPHAVNGSLKPILEDAPMACTQRHETQSALVGVAEDRPVQMPTKKSKRESAVFPFSETHIALSAQNALQLMPEKPAE